MISSPIVYDIKNQPYRHSIQVSVSALKLEGHNDCL